MTIQEWMDYVRLVALAPGVAVSTYGLWSSLFRTLLPYYKQMHGCPQVMLMRYVNRVMWFIILLCLTTNSVNRLWLGDQVVIGLVSQGAFTLLLMINIP